MAPPSLVTLVETELRSFPSSQTAASILTYLRQSPDKGHNPGFATSSQLAAALKIDHKKIESAALQGVNSFLTPGQLAGRVFFNSEEQVIRRLDLFEHAAIAGCKGEVQFEDRSISPLRFGYRSHLQKGMANFFISQNVPPERAQTMANSLWAVAAGWAINQGTLLEFSTGRDFIYLPIGTDRTKTLGALLYLGNILASGGKKGPYDVSYWTPAHFAQDFQLLNKKVDLQDPERKSQAEQAAYIAFGYGSHKDIATIILTSAKGMDKIFSGSTSYPEATYAIVNSRLPAFFAQSIASHRLSQQRESLYSPHFP